MLNFALKYPSKRKKGRLALSRRQSKWGGGRGNTDVAVERRHKDMDRDGSVLFFADGVGILVPMLYPDTTGWYHEEKVCNGYMGSFCAVS